ADDSFEVRQVRQLVLLLSIFVAAALRRIKVDLKEIEELCLPLRAETRIPLNPTPISGRDRRLQKPNADQCRGIHLPDRGGLAAGPAIGQVLPKRPKVE